MTGKPGVSDVIARFLLDAEVESSVREHVRTVAAAVVSAAMAAGDGGTPRASTAIVDEVDAGVVHPIGSDQLRSVPDAALLTAVAAATGTADATDLRVAVAVVAAAAAQAELVGADSDAFVDAVAVGLEVGLRMADAVGQPYLDRGWDVTGVAGSVGAAAAVARLERASVETTLQILGVAATQGAGLRAARDTDTWLLHVGKAASNGVEAALLCASGFSGPPAGIEGRRGFLPVAAPEGDASRLTDGLGERWSLRAVQPDPAVAVADGVSAALVDAADVIARLREVGRSGAGSA